LFEIVEEEIQRLNGLVTELLRFARPVNVERSDVVLADTLAALGASMDDTYSMRVEIAEDADVRTVWADPTLLRLALGNVVANACQAMPDGGDILVTASQEEIDGTAFVRIDIADRGPGMTQETLARAVDPFFTTSPKGTGLGLPIARRIAEAHDGTLSIESERGRGTVVHYRLPARRRDSLGLVDPRPSTTVVANDETADTPSTRRPLAREHPG
jgi:signal transduction histidine kinase